MPSLHYKLLFLQFLTLIFILFPQSSFQGIQLFQTAQSIFLLPQPFISFYTIVSHYNRFPTHIFLNLSLIFYLSLNKLLFDGVVHVSKAGSEQFIVGIVPLSILHIHYFLILLLLSGFSWDQLISEAFIVVNWYSFELLFNLIESVFILEIHFHLYLFTSILLFHLFRLLFVRFIIFSQVQQTYNQDCIKSD